MLQELASTVTEQGDALLEWRDRSVGGVWHGAQLKTEADTQAHQGLSSALRELLDLPVVSEEDVASQTATRPERYWLIDPIDGTASLAGGFSGFVLQAALMEFDRPVLAAIRAPALCLTYTAGEGAGAFCNGMELKVERESERRVLIDNYPEPRGVARDVMSMLPCTGYVESGSIALKICRIADGTADIFIKDVPVRDWDVAAPLLILKEAGGNLQTGCGGPYAFVGGYEKQGLIAARCEELSKRILKVLAKEPIEQERGVPCRNP